MKKKPISKENTLTSSHDIRVRFDEVDSIGIVWHGHYVKYFEEGREAFGREFGISYLDAKENLFATPIVEFHVENLFPLRYGEIATVETEFINTDAAKLCFSFRITNQEGKLVCRGKTTQVFTNFQGEMVLTNPDFFKQWKIKNGLLDA